MTDNLDDALRMEAQRLARRRARKRRDSLALRVGVLDDLCIDRNIRLPAEPTIVDVAAFFEIDRGPLTTLLRDYREELLRDGWEPRHPRHDGQDYWSEEAIVRAALLLDSAVGCDSEVAEQIRYFLGQGELPLVFSVTDARLSQSAKLYSRAIELVADVHGEQCPAAVWRELQDMPRYQLQSLAIALAAIVPDDRPGLGRYLCELSSRPGSPGSRERGLALLIPRCSKLLKRRRQPGRPQCSSEPGGATVVAER
ncbi:hypothetical protein [Mycobacterium sp. TY815]|uniref:hypothetical protein n=1 Tax=Mycobacterium sp. TY815 TaxID=3050581 RepID=UPI002740D9C7|nr:hypothetical protein [Mycobacterium sp. TY815]MDP7707480.1 hypothetical protein [Mycobacterium sp. TY815]